MSVEPEIGTLDLDRCARCTDADTCGGCPQPVPEPETPCCIQMQGERCARHGPAVERPAPEGCAGCAARDVLALFVRWVREVQEMGVYSFSDDEGMDGLLMKANRALAASPKESRRHE